MNLNMNTATTHLTGHRYNLILQSLCGAMVLLVENDRSHQKLMLKMLAKAGVQLDIAKDVEEAIQMIVKVSYDIVLLDVELPQIDGYTAANIIRSVMPELTIPIVAILGSNHHRDREKCFQSGMNDYIRKPLSDKLLCATLALWMRKEMNLA